MAGERLESSGKWEIESTLAHLALGEWPVGELPFLPPDMPGEMDYKNELRIPIDPRLPGSIALREPVELVEAA